jgi:hypothetical protein
MIAVAALVISIWAAPPPPETVRAAVKAIREDASYQKTLPPPIPETPPRPSSERESSRESGGADGGGGGGGGSIEDDGWEKGSDGKWKRKPRHRRTAPTGDPREPRAPADWNFELSEFWKIVLYVVAAILVVAVVTAFVRAFLSREREKKEVRPAAVPAHDPARPVPAAAFDDADRLAHEGRFAEAIHALLLRTLAGLSERGVGLADSSTSREIVRDAALTGEARSELGGLVESVEVSRFGSVVPDAAEYAACRARFERLAGARPAPVGAA